MIDWSDILARVVAFAASLVVVSYIVFAWRYSLSVEPLTAILFWLWNILAVTGVLVLALVVVKR